MKMCFIEKNPFGRRSIIIKSVKQFAVVLIIAAMVHPLVQATPSLKPEYSNIVDNVWKNKKHWLIDQINTTVNGDGTSSDSYVLYDTAFYTASLLYYAKSIQNIELLDGIAEVYLAAYPKLTTNCTRYIYAYWPGNHGVNNLSVHDIASPAKMWLDTPVVIGTETLGQEDVLSSSQFLYEAAQLCNAIADIPANSRTACMNDFLEKFVPVILDDHYKRWIFAANLANSKGVFQVHAWGGQDEHNNHKDFLQKKHDFYFTSTPAISYMNMVTDCDMYIVGGVVEMLAANAKDSTNIPIDSTFKQDLLDYVVLGSDLLSDRMTDSTLTNFSSSSVAGTNFDLGFLDDRPDNYYSGYEGLTSPLGQAHDPADNIGWDVSHARRFVSVFNTLYDNKNVTNQTFPSQTTMQKLTNQLVYGAFNKDLTTEPKTRNYMDGIANGWYRVGYHDANDPGIPPYGLSNATAVGGYGFWSKFNSDATLMENAIWGKIQNIYAKDVSGRFRHYPVSFQTQKYGSGSSGANPGDGGYITFDSTNKYISPAMDSDYATSQGTIEFWYKPDAANTDYEYPAFISASGAVTNDWWIKHNVNHTLTLRVAVSNSAIINLTTTETIGVGQWNHIAVTQNGTNAKIYINGVLATTSGANSGSHWTDHLSAAGYVNISQTTHPCKGKIDDFRIYSKALSGADILAEYKAPRLMAHWTFDSTHSYAINQNTSVAAGKVGQGMSFTGLSSPTSLFRSWSSADFNSLTGSVQMWINPVDAGSSDDLVVVGTGSSGASYLRILKTAADKIQVLIFETGGNTRVNLTSSVSVSAGVWTHVAVTQDGIAGVKIYINGVEDTNAAGVNSSAYWTNHITAALPYIQCGASVWSTSYYKGTIDELQIFRGALSADDVKKNCALGKSVYNRTFDWSSETYYYNNTTPSSGKIGQGASFDGTSQYCRSAADSNLASAVGSVQMWFYADDATERDLIFVTANGSSGSDYLFIRKSASNKIVIGIKDFPDSNFKVCLTSDAAITVGAWNHIAVTQDGSGVKIYINCNLSSTTGTNSGSYWTNHIVNPYVKYGCSAWNWYKGKIDELQMYDYALNGTQIAQEFNRGDQSARWEFDAAPTAAALDFVKTYYGTDYDAANSLLLLQFLPSLMTWQ